MSRSERLIDAEALKDKTVGIVGVGGLGTTAAALLARQGINLVLADGDIVEETNLERQILYGKADVGRPKVWIAREHLAEFCHIVAVFEHIDSETIAMLEDVDLILDCTDSIETRLVIDAFSKEKGVPWIYSAGVKTIGALYFNDPHERNRPAFTDFSKGKVGESACDVGVLNATVSAVASLSVKMAVDYLLNGSYPQGMLRLDLDSYTISEVDMRKMLRVNQDGC
ncbi:MAG: HesA/MoeB/ThiF family protein [Nanoarchaeota archaeon]